MEATTVANGGFSVPSARLSGVRVRPYARLGCLGPSAGCGGCLMVLVAAIAALALVIGAM